VQIASGGEWLGDRRGGLLAHHDGLKTVHELIRVDGVGGKRASHSGFPKILKTTIPMNTRRTSIETPEPVNDHLRSLIAEAEKTMGTNFSQEAAESLSSVRERLSDIKEKVEDGVTFAREKIVAGARQADTAIRMHPYETIAIALGVGVLLGVLLRRKED